MKKKALISLGIGIIIIVVVVMSLLFFKKPTTEEYSSESTGCKTLEFYHL